jgi:4'-phosphopantetheinyl transferase
MHKQIAPRWRAGPASPRLQPDRVDIWWIDLAAVPGSPTGAQRSAAHRARDDILGRYLGQTAAALNYGTSPGGKPFLHGASEALQFNLSHTLGSGLIAVAADLAVGVDIEPLRRVENPLRIARRVMSAQDIALLTTLRPQARVYRFLDLWTRMEARQKAVGRGIFQDLVDPCSVLAFSFQPRVDLFAALAVSPARGSVDLRFFHYAEP